VLHSFYLVTSALMLGWYVRYELLPIRVVARMHSSPDAAGPL
jgi:hypothetical protein